MSDFTPLVTSLPSSVPFVGPEALERRSGNVIQARIGANESVFGPAPSVIKAMQDHAAEAWMYGDPENHDLKQALAAHLGVGPENICVGEGIDGLFGYALRLFVEPGISVATSLGAYPTFNFHVAGFGGRLVTTPYVEDREDPASLLKLVKAEKARVVYLANPDNPMGTVWPATDIQKLVDALPETTTLMLDEAYAEFANPDARPALDITCKNVLRFRTFSKAYGLAGMRIGYVIGHPDVIRAFDKIRNHFGMTRLSQIAGIAALKDQAWLQHVVGEVENARERIYQIVRQHNLGPIRSATNFVAVDCGKDGAYAKSLVDGLLKEGVFVRMPGVAPLNRCIRISAGKKEQLDLLEAALSKIL